MIRRASRASPSPLAASLVRASVVAGLGLGGMALAGAVSSPPPALAGAASADEGSWLDGLRKVGGGDLAGEGRLGFHIAFRDGPPARVTGGFGEDSCGACHWNGAEDDGPGTLELHGFPEAYEPGARYPLEITLTDPDLVVACFQLAVRHPADESQVGTLEVPDTEEERVGILVDREVEFAQHRLGGIEPTEETTTRWSVEWVAPDEAGVPVVLHLAALAADGDQSQIGDRVYTRAFEITGAPPTSLYIHRR